MYVCLRLRASRDEKKKNRNKLLNGNRDKNETYTSSHEMLFHKWSYSLPLPSKTGNLNRPSPVVAVSFRTCSSLQTCTKPAAAHCKRTVKLHACWMRTLISRNNGIINFVPHFFHATGIGRGRGRRSAKKCRFCHANCSAQLEESVHNTTVVGCLELTNSTFNWV